MTERAAQLIDHVFPDVPARQWVLALPHRLRYLLAWNHDLCRAVSAVSLRAILGFLRHRARAAGLADSRGGAVVIMQRFGGALNLNPHLHVLVPDGVFVAYGDDVRFRPRSVLDTLDVAEVLATIVPGIRRLLARWGLGDETGDPDGATHDAWADAEPLLAGLAAASVQNRVALGPRAGRAIRRSGEWVEPADGRPLGPCQARQDGFDLQAAVRIPAGHRDRLERICRYALRPPVATDRLRLTDAGQVVLELRRRWADGTTHLVFDPVELLERLAAITPRPRINLVLYYGVLGARSTWRAEVVPKLTGGQEERPGASEPCPAGHRWADLMRRSFGYDVLACPKCAGRLGLLAVIEDPRVIRRILPHLGLPTDGPEPRPARDPPVLPNGATSPTPNQLVPVDFDA